MNADNAVRFFLFFSETPPVFRWAFSENAEVLESIFLKGALGLNGLKVILNRASISLES